MGIPGVPAKQREAIEMDITGVAKSHHAGIPKPSSKKEWKLSDSLREQIAEYAREDAAQNVYMGNKFLALRNHHAKPCPQTRINTGFLLTPPLKKSPPGREKLFSKKFFILTQHHFQVVFLPDFVKNIHFFQRLPPVFPDHGMGDAVLLGKLLPVHPFHHHVRYDLRQLPA